MSYELKTVIGEDVEVVAFFDYQPFEPSCYQQGENGYPGCSEAVENMTVCIKKGYLAERDITDSLSRDCLNSLEMECLMAVRSGEEAA